ncbi:MAG: hypothetical protein PF569_01030 [Candidatus Woesearchaeota archaeon]|jgi:hypothetical protein|nr:hypothetical protein [Candidatus Woesearchaeota archaeon]
MSQYKKRILYFTLIFFIISFITNIYSIPVIPQENGFGIETQAGREGEIYRVTNLNSSGEGSLRDCINSKESRICIFEISGTIYINDNLNIKNPYITIAGQTAPSPGITLKGAGIAIQTHDVLIQHLRIRVGDSSNGPDPENRDAILIGSNSNEVYNIVVDHISASWAIDEIISTWSEKYLIYNITISNSIFSEALFNSKHPDGKHSMGVLIGKNSNNIILKNNIFAHNSARNPLIRDDSTNIIILNNLIYNSGTSSKNKIYFGSRGSKNIPLNASVIGNIYIPKTNEDSLNNIYIEEESSSDMKLYLKDNLVPLSNKSNDWETVYGRNDPSIRVDTPPIWNANLKTIPVSIVKENNLQYSGARPLDRDIVDERIIVDIIKKEGEIIDSQNDVGGWPNLTINKLKLATPKNPNNDDDNDGYTNIEEWLHSYSYNIEIKTNESLLVKNIEEIDTIIPIKDISFEIVNETQINNTINQKQSPFFQYIKIGTIIAYLGIIITGIFIIILGK